MPNFGPPVTIVTAGGVPHTQVGKDTNRGAPATVVSAGGEPIQLVPSGGQPIVLLNPNDTEYANIADQVIEFGALTAANTGGARLVDGNGNRVDVTGVSLVSGQSGWTHSGGRLIRSTGTPATSDGTILACTTALGTVNVTIKSSGTDANGYNLANCHSVASTSQLATVLATTLTLGIHHVLCRAGDMITATDEAGIYSGQIVYPAAYTGTITRPSNLAVASGMTAGDRGVDVTTGNYINVRPHAGDEGRVNMKALWLRHTTSSKGGIRLTGLNFGWTPLVKLPGQTTQIVTISIDDVCIDNCVFQGAPDDTNIILMADNVYATAVTLDGFRPCANFTLQDNTFRDTLGISSILLSCDNVKIVGNDIKRSWRDRFYFGGAGTNILVAWNKVTEHREFFDGPHPDYMQLAGLEATAPLDGLRVIGNLFYFGNTRANDNDGQGIFIKDHGQVIGFDTQVGTFTGYTTVTDGTSGASSTIVKVVDNGSTGTLTVYPAATTPNFGVGNTISTPGGNTAVVTSVTDLMCKNVTIRGNICYLSISNGIFVENPENVTIKNNVVLMDRAANDAYGGLVLYSSIIFNGKGAGTNVISENIANVINANSLGTASNNTATGNPALFTDYQKLFVNAAERSAMTDPGSQFELKSVETAPFVAYSSSPRHGACEYVDYDTRTTTFPDATWTQVFTLPVGTEVNSADWNAYNFVQTVPIASINPRGGTQIRLTIEGPVGGSEDMSIGALWVGNGGGADPFDFTGDQVQLKQGGNNTIVVPRGGVVTTDAAAFVKDATNDLVVALQFGDTANDTIRILTTNQYGQNYIKVTSNDAATQNKSGYNNYANSLCITKIELLI